VSGRDFGLLADKAGRAVVVEQRHQLRVVTGLPGDQPDRDRDQKPHPFASPANHQWSGHE
jgi:hypothetical protein